MNEPTPTGPRPSARPCWSPAGDRVEIARQQIRDGSHLLDLCVDYVGRDVNHEDGDGEKSPIRRVMPIVVEHGAAVVALTIDEQGQARTAERKVRLATVSSRT